MGVELVLLGMVKWIWNRGVAMYRHVARVKASDHVRLRRAGAKDRRRDGGGGGDLARTRTRSSSYCRGFSIRTRTQESLLDGIEGLGSSWGRESCGFGLRVEAQLLLELLEGHCRSHVGHGGRGCDEWGHWRNGRGGRGRREGVGWSDPVGDKGLRGERNGRGCFVGGVVGGKGSEDGLADGAPVVDDDRRSRWLLLLLMLLVMRRGLEGGVGAALSWRSRVT
mmetsp:Transcript_35080/g.58678  ORF Transcript_35080/g.58678 Transcript_35080/m.58678 type:complete len:223 (+) Transcript_35080:579-1247(+)